MDSNMSGEGTVYHSTHFRNLYTFESLVSDLGVCVHVEQYKVHMGYRQPWWGRKGAIVRTPPLVARFTQGLHSALAAGFTQGLHSALAAGFTQGLH